MHVQREFFKCNAHFKMEMQWRESWEGHLVATLLPAAVLFRNNKPLMHSSSRVMVKHLGVWFCKSKEKFMVRDASTSTWAVPITVRIICSLLFGIALLLSLSFPPKAVCSLLMEFAACTPSCGTCGWFSPPSSPCQLSGAHLEVAERPLLLLSVAGEVCLQPPRPSCLSGNRCSLSPFLLGSFWFISPKCTEQCGHLLQ